MRSQVWWGILLIVIGAAMASAVFPFLLIYGIPLIVIGIVLILYRRREETIEQVRE
jgi:hypothetical protein